MSQYMEGELVCEEVEYVVSTVVFTLCDKFLAEIIVGESDNDSLQWS
jgi:hypothetical protein